MDDLPSDYDAIVIGTGMTGSIVAASLSRIGKSVLHLDENDYYGEEWASFTLETFQQWISKQQSPIDESVADASTFINPGETFVPLTRKQRFIRIEQKWKCPKEEIKEPVIEGEKENEKADESEKKIWTEDKLRAEYRKFNLDLSPRMVYSRGPLVELLISSNISKYTEFKSVSRVLTWRDDHLEVVPCSRADVFATRHVSVVQKRMLVKILSVIAEQPTREEEFEGFENKTFIEYLKHKKLDAQLIHYILYAIAMADVGTSCMEGVEACQRFLQSLGRYGNTPFISPLYGAGEIPQCFCRMCAVFGGIYYLKRRIDGFIVKDGEVNAILSEGKRLTARHFIVTSSLCPQQFATEERRKPIHRAVFITDRSLVESEKEQVTLLQFPPQGETESKVTVMEMGNGCQVCPKDLFVVHMTAEAENKDGGYPLRAAEAALFQQEDDEADKKPKVLWTSSWEMCADISMPSVSCPTNFKIFSGPDASIDYDATIAEGKAIFESLYPEEDFLPRAPDSDEIVMDEPETSADENNPAVTSGDESELEYEKDGLKTSEKGQGEPPNVELVGSEDESKNLEPVETNCDMGDGETKNIATDLSQVTI